MWFCTAVQESHKVRRNLLQVTIKALKLPSDTI